MTCDLLELIFPTDKLDEEVVQDGVKVFIDKKAQLSLLGKSAALYNQSNIWILNAFLLCYRHRNGLCRIQAIQRIRLQQSKYKGHVWLRRIV